MVAIINATSNNATTLKRALSFSRLPAGHPAAAPDRGHLRLQRQLNSILKGIKSPVMEETVEHVFNGLTRLRDILRIIELNVEEDGSLAVTLAAFALVDSESKSLVRFIETRISNVKSIKGPLREALDSTGFALRHEIKGVFGHALAGVVNGQPATQVRADVMRAHGLLSNCFQQSILSLAQAFDPGLAGELLFDDYRDRRKQSAVLLRELSTLVQLARRAGEPTGADGSGLLIEALKLFCRDTIRYLMYKDWKEFEDIAADVMSSQGSARHDFILHCFVTYLEALINQVRMRTVLNDPSLGISEPKPLKKSRGGRR